jgi:RNA polymerase sigma-70 factor (ECF subfamily)
MGSSKVAVERLEAANVRDRNGGWNWDDLRGRCRAEAMRVLRDPEAADEAAQEAMTRAWRQRGSCQSPSAPGPWVAQIARNEALRLWQRERRREARSGDVEEEAAGEPLEDQLIRRVAVRQALATLTAEERELVNLRYESDLAHPAIAAVLGLPEGTVKVRLHRIRKRLATLIAEPL